MCGIAGFLHGEANADRTRLETIGNSMATAIAHRGPDAAGVWCDPQVGICLAHRRLSIIDLSAAGAQPMQSSCGRYVLAFNGEIYNFRDLRLAVEKAADFGGWRGASDTEVLVEGVRVWGVEKALQNSVGMFAIAIWDRSTRELILARDRVGEKPLYYGLCRGNLLFGSELKALLSHPAFSAEIDRDAVALFLRHNYIPAPCTIYTGIYKLSPGTFFRVTLADIQQGKLPRAQPYWTLDQAIQSGRAAPLATSASEATGELEKLLAQSIKGQMVSDVPLGALLSGGIDSSTVVALMQAQSHSKVKTFTIGFHEAGYDEAKHAAMVAKHLGTDHHELYVTAEQAQAVIPSLPTVFDEPFSDSSQIPTLLVSRLARTHVTVALSGDGGDELFGGYNRYAWATKLWSMFGKVPRPLRGPAARVARGTPPGVVNWSWSVLKHVMPKHLRFENASDKLHKAADLLELDSEESLYLELVSHWKAPKSVLLSGDERQRFSGFSQDDIKGLDYTSGMMRLDTLTYLPDDILVKVDRAAMSVSLETRVPLLDHRLIEFAWRLPVHMKIRGDSAKWLLKEVLYRHVPKALVDRPKMGFGVPIDTWLRGPLREWAEHLLAKSRLDQQGIFQSAPIRKCWEQHLAGTHNWQYHLWDILMFQAWCDNNSHT